MSPHQQFWIADIVAMLVTCPLLVVAWRRRLRRRAAITGFYAAGFGVIALTLIVDGFINPPLFLHGFGAGVGIGILLASLGLFGVSVARPPEGPS